MKLIKTFIILSFLVCLGVYAQNEYRVYTIPQIPTVNPSEGVETLFILDYSNSMNEMLLEKSKYQVLIESMHQLLPKLIGNKVGVRIYGHRWGLTPFDSCRASSLIIPISDYECEFITEGLKKYKPRGMSPITYSLKQAIKNDFKNDNKEKHIVLITDGGENCDESPCKYAMELIKYRKDIKIDVIAINIDNEDDLDQLRCSANVTGGKFYNATTQAQLLRNMENAVNTSKHVDAKLLY